MRILLVDDESLARQRLASLLKELGYTDIVGEAANGVQALQEISRTNPDVVFLDIRMPVMDGIEVARHLKALPFSPKVIFTTAYDQHALSAFETNALDYLLKPIQKERLHEAILRAEKLQPDNKSQLPNTQETKRSQICAYVKGKLQLIPVNSIYYFVADQKYVLVRHTQGQVLIEESLTSLEQEFGDEFLRVHRNALVASQYLSGTTKGDDEQMMLTFAGIEDKIAISRRHLPSIRKWLKSAL